jgi:hypothetical protein
MEPPRPLGKSFGLRNERLRAPACRMIPALLVGSTAKQYNRGAVDLAQFIGLGNQEPPLRFLIIGGYAVAAHGHTRATFDVDFLVRRADRELWGARLTQSGLTLFGETRAFAQFTQGDQGDGLDLMFVQEATFESMWERSEERDFGGTLARVPSLDHLLALKLHALKQALPHRTSKDAEDVETLLRRNRIDLRQRQYEELFLKYGTRELYDTFLRLLREP